MPLNDAYQLQPWISVPVQNAYALNRTSIHIRSRKKIKNPSVAEIEIFPSSSHRQVISTD